MTCDHPPFTRSTPCAPSLHPVPRLVLIRHAKSSWTTDLDDPDRPLSNRGRRDALALGTLLRDRGIVPDLLWSSDAVRATQTWTGAQAAGAVAARVERRPELYGASGDEVRRLAMTAPQVDTLAVIGHHSGIPDCLTLLARRGDEAEASDAVWTSIDRKYPTSACALLECPPWPDLVPGSARLLWYQVPRG